MKAQAPPSLLCFLMAIRIRTCQTKYAELEHTFYIIALLSIMINSQDAVKEYNF